MLASQFAQSFPQLYEFLIDKDKLDLRVQEMVAGEPTNRPLSRLLYSPGPRPNPDAVAWHETVNSHLMRSTAHPETMRESVSMAYDMVFNAWTFQAERAFHGLASYIKCVPGFSDLLLDDRIILLKQGRVEALNILK